MSFFSFFRKSLGTKLVLAFTLVTAPSILISSYIAARLVNDLANAHIGDWLQQTSRRLLRGIKDTEDALAAVHTLLSARFANRQVVFSPEELQALARLYVHCVVLRDESGSILLSDSGLESVAEDSLYPGSALRWVTMKNGKKALAVAARHDITLEDGGKRGLELVSLFDIRRMAYDSQKPSERGLELASLFGIRFAESAAQKSVEFHIFLPDGNGFRQGYTSLSCGSHVMPPAAIQALQAGDEEYSIIDKDWLDDEPDAYVSFTPARNDRGDILAVFVVSVPMFPHTGYTRLFWFFLVCGALLSGCIGYILAKTLTKPIRQLTDGVRNIAVGNFSNRMSARGGDEVTELAASFNLMAEQLEHKQRENVQAARHERSRMLGEIALGFAHEIRNPLLVIKTSAELVYGKLAGGDKESRLLNFVIEEVGRIDNLISEFLSFAKPVPLKLGHFRLNALVKEVLELTAAECAVRDIVCSFVDEAGQSDLVFAAADKIRQVLLNLVLNSLDAMPHGGSLTIRVYAQDHQPHACFEVKDTGVGIPKELLPTIHLPFISTKKSGLGLGLAKAYAIVEEHGGNIACVSTPGQGTVFTVCLNS